MTDDATTLDDVDRAIVLAVHRHRRDNDQGPTWAEVRAAVPAVPPRPDCSVAAFREWWADPANRADMENDHLERFFDQHPDTTSPDAAFGRYCFRIWRARRLAADPLAIRFGRLKWAGYLSYSNRERSLDVGRLVKAQLRRQKVNSG